MRITCPDSFPVPDRAVVRERDLIRRLSNPVESSPAESRTPSSAGAGPMVVAKLKGALDRKRVALAMAAEDDRTVRVKVEGRKSYAERNPDLVRLAKRLHRDPINGRRRSLRDVSKALSLVGYFASSGKFGATAIARMVDASA